MNFIRRIVGPALLAVFAAFLIAQVLVRPAVGIANNGDFPKVAGKLALGPEDADWSAYRQYSHFIYRFVRDDRYAWERDLRTAEFLSSEFLLAKLARGLQRVIRPGPRFDIRWLGAVSGALFVLAVGLWLYALPSRWRLLLGPPLILIWSDVAYMQYLNSFYMDAAAMIFLVLTVAAGLHVANNRHSRAWPLAMTFAAVLFTTSKSQHAVVGLVFIPLFVALTFWSRDRVARAVWLAGSAALALGTYVLVGRQTVQWISANTFDVVFLRLAPQSPDPARTLEEIGLRRSDVAFMGMHAYLPNGPMQNPAWVRDFHARCNYGALLRYYLRHPVVTSRLLYAGLSGPASNIRPYANLSPDDGFKEDARTSHFTWWTNLRSFLLKHAPWHVILLVSVMVAGSLWLLFRSPVDRPFAGMLIVIEILAAAEYSVSLLADGVETDRHLMVFHVAIEISILLLPVLLWKIHAWRRRTSAQAAAAPSSAPAVA